MFSLFKTLYSRTSFCLLFAFFSPMAFSAATDNSFLTFPSLPELLTNIAEQMPYLWDMVTGAAYITGFFLVILGLHHLKRAGEQHGGQGGGLKSALMSLVVGVILIFSPSSLESAVATFFGSNAPLSYPSGSGAFYQLGAVLVAIIQFFGLVAFIRGLMHFHKLGSGHAQPGTFGKGMTHLIGGVLCMNILGTASVIGSTLGITITPT